MLKAAKLLFYGKRVVSLSLLVSENFLQKGRFIYKIVKKNNFILYCVRLITNLFLCEKKNKLNAA